MKSINNRVIILGNSAAIPTKNRHLTSQVIIFGNSYFLVDCGEGTQMQLINYKIKYHKIDNIFISHLHGDHFYGLIGLISTYHLLGREKTLTIYSPPGLEEIIRLQLKVTKSILKFELEFIEITSSHKILIFQNDNTAIYAFPLEHRVPCYGYLFIEKQLLLNIKKQFVEDYKPTVEQIITIKHGGDFITSEGKLIKNHEITIKPKATISYAYCSDTRYNDDIPQYIKNVTMLYHEATFDNSMKQKAIDRYHSTAADAAKCALNSNAKKLLLGHFSARKIDQKSLLSEATNIFNNTLISEEGKEYYIE